MIISAIDTETTGLIAGKHDLLQIGIISYDTETGNSKGFLIHHEYNDFYEISPKALEVNGYYLGKWKEMGIECDRNVGANALVDIINVSDILLAHNAPFDSKFINWYLEKYATVQPTKRVYWMDTTFISFTEKLNEEKHNEFFPNNKTNSIKKFSLDNLISHFKLDKLFTDRNNKHDALEDAKLTLAAFIEFFNKLQPYKIKRLTQLEIETTIIQ